MHTTGAGGAAAAGGIMILIFAVYALIFAIVVGFLIFWIIALVDCAKRDFPGENDKLIWILVIVLAHGLGALIYWFVGRPKGVMRT